MFLENHVHVLVSYKEINVSIECESDIKLNVKGKF